MRPHIHSWSSMVLDLCRDGSAEWIGVRARWDKLKGGELELWRPWARPITQAYNLEVRRAFLP